MKKFFLIAALLCATVPIFVACNNDNDAEKERQEAINLDYSTENANAWGNYSSYVADLLDKDAQMLHEAWVKSFRSGEAYATTLKNHNSGSYKTAKDAVLQIVDGCTNIANEVGEAKIGDPLKLWLQGKRQEALYSVESWYSWHSRDDYTNNIYSVRNAFYGNTTGTISRDMAANPSILGFIATKGDIALVAETTAAIDKAARAIQAIPQPFRNNISSEETKAAQQACADLNDLLTKKVRPFLAEQNTTADEAVYHQVVAQYVDAVVLPTYAKLATATRTLKDKVDALRTNPSNAAFKAAAESWIQAREPWEMSEAFLFGPVADLGLDPNMDSWPLDQVGIVNILRSGNFSALNWNGEYQEGDAKIEAAQTLRGFHTLEFLLFKDGQPRTVK